MEQNSTNPPAPRRGAPIWAQILAWAGVLALLALLGLGLLKAQHPIMAVNSSVPDFTLSLYKGYEYQGASQVKLSDLRGKVVVVNFWASWCLTCADEQPFLEAAWKDYQPGGEVIFLGVDYTDIESKARDYMTRFGVSYPNGPDLGTRIAPMFNRNIAMPETYIIDQNGILRYQQIGPFASLAELKAAIGSVLGGR